MYEETSDDDSDISEYIKDIIHGRYDHEGVLEYKVTFMNFPKSYIKFIPFNKLNKTAKQYIKDNNVPIVNNK